MDTENDICRQCEHSGHVTESDCDECALTMTNARLDPAPISKTPVAIIPKVELAALRAQLAAAVAALEAIANDPGYKMSQALNEAHLWEMTAKRRQQMARQALAEIRGDNAPMSQLAALGARYDIIQQATSGKHGVRIWLDDTRTASSELHSELNAAIEEAIEKYQRMKAVDDGKQA